MAPLLSSRRPRAGGNNRRRFESCSDSDLLTRYTGTAPSSRTISGVRRCRRPYRLYAQLIKLLKSFLKFAAHRSGAIHLVQQLNRDRLRILMYHRFPAQHADAFDRQCAFLASRYQVVSLPEALARLWNHQPIENLAVLTIDDGYADMAEVAFPILRKHRLPATLFVTTGFIDQTHWMPGDRVRSLLDQTTLALTADDGTVHHFSATGPNASDDLGALLKRVPNRTRTRILAELASAAGQPSAAPPPPEYRPCTWDQLREMSRNGITIGAHTVSHPILSRLETAEETEREILDSKITLERRLETPVTVFAYPNGMKEDLSPTAIACVRAQFAGAVTAIYGLNATGVDPYCLYRLPGEPDMSVPDLARMLAGPLRHRQPAPITPLQKAG